MPARALPRIARPDDHVKVSLSTRGYRFIECQGHRFLSAMHNGRGHGVGVHERLARVGRRIRCDVQHPAKTPLGEERGALEELAEVVVIDLEDDAIQTGIEVKDTDGSGRIHTPIENLIAWRDASQGRGISDKPRL